MPIPGELAFEVRAEVDPPLVLGDTSRGFRRVVPIKGGTVKGPRLNGVVLPGGADWQYVRPDGVLAVEARYTLRLDDGALVSVVNRGLRHGPEEVMARLTRGERVDPQSYYFRTAAEFEAPRGPHEWLNRAIFVGIATRLPDAAIVSFYAVT